MQPIPYWGEELDGEWVYEPKYDGWRLQVIVNDEIQLWGRRLEKNPNWTEKLKWLVKDTKLPKGTILDCELCTDKGRNYIPGLFTGYPRAEGIINVFDIVYYKGKFIGNPPYYERKEILKELKLKKPFRIIEPIKLGKDVHPEKIIREFLKIKIDNLIEGIVLKKRDSLYLPGKDGPLGTADWRKMKDLIYEKIIKIKNGN